MAKRYTFLLFIAVFTLGLSAQSTDVPTGRWQTLDDETGETNSIIEIYEQDGKYFGRIVEILTDNKNALCTKCSGAKKDQPIKGLVIIENLEKSGDYWKGGTILDPKKGADYKLSAWFENSDSETLFIRGKHWTGIYRTQTWKRKK
ncbi:DUF2147 domain-containing protein [Neolewinella persica]|uniref:DUF2147 domain-containing protein n=1 Tax=Neolewinella persica TaxID=70998 RepID=UPI00035DBB14|nr:DUF2147 domain-containing protein [Neolewinella persica]